MYHDLGRFTCTLHQSRNGQASIKKPGKKAAMPSGNIDIKIPSPAQPQPGLIKMQIDLKTKGHHHHNQDANTALWRTIKVPVIIGKFDIERT